jgi:phosphoesterase RecJ-like protein
MKIDRAAIRDTILRGDNFLITSHINPDGDSIGSQLALRRTFSLLGKKSVIVNTHPVPRIYRFLPGSADILVRQRHSLRPYSALFVLDCGHPSRASGFLDRQRDLTVVNFDHHATNTGYGDLNWVVRTASSTCELIFDLALKTGVSIDSDLATCLYAGILTDTGSFRYSSTTPRSMSIASRLMRYGIDPHVIAENIYENSEFSSLRLLGRILARMGKTVDGSISWVSLSHAELSSLSNVSETEEFVNYARSLNTARLAIGLKEIRPGQVRVSFRSKGNVDVSELAARYGGGGHRNAAGCSLTGSLRKVQKRLVADARLYLKNSSGDHA